MVPFDGKVRDDVVEKQGDFKYKRKMFTLPGATVGSILEYRYQVTYEDVSIHPQWHLQGDLFKRAASYSWRPGDTNFSTQISWAGLLPKGVVVQQGKKDGLLELKVEVHDVLPLPKEDFTPPSDLLEYHVYFYYTTYKDAPEFWEKVGEEWARERDQFIGPGPKVKAYVSKLKSEGESPEQTLRKIYAAVSKMENTDLTRKRTEQEEKSQGLKSVKDADDVLVRGRGDGYDLTQLFVAMARAAGMKAYVMGVADRSERIFSESYMSFRQLADDVAIVELDGKDKYFDPGAGGCSYGELAWYDSQSTGVRQKPGGGSELAHTPVLDLKDTVTKRLANLAVDADGVATGKVQMSYTGAAAQRWRREWQNEDQTGLEKDLKEKLEGLLPEGFEVKLEEIVNLTELGQPLIVNYDIKGPLGVSTGKRLMFPASLFETRTKARFPQATRTMPIDMYYAYALQDAVRLRLPQGFTVEGEPAAAAEKMPNVAGFDMDVKQQPGAVTLNRDLYVGRAYVSPDQYPALRHFFGAVEAKDQDKLVLIRTVKDGGTN